jgi:microcystin degradation protein MlrC
MRYAIAGFMHESNTFNPLGTDRQAFEDQYLKYGPPILEDWRAGSHELSGFIDAADADGVELLPVVMAWATPSGPVVDSVLDEITGHICQTLNRQTADGLLLALHGAMVGESFADADGEVLRRIRQAVGPDFPVVVTFDLHGNISEQMIANCDAAVTYRTNPHMDQHDCGLRAASLLRQLVVEKKEIYQALAKPPLIISIAVQDTSKEPLQHLMRGFPHWDEDPVILDSSLALGFPYADVPQMGPSVIVITNEDAERARLEADAFANHLWEARKQMTAHLPEAPEAVAQALRAKETPVVLVDFGDNVGGGSAGDGTILLHELLRQGATHALICLSDQGSVQACALAGVNGLVRLTVGGKVDRLHGEPVEVTGRVRVLHDGTYLETATRHGGRRVNHMGLTAVVEIDGHNLLVLNSYRHPPFSLGQLTCLGIQPELQRIIVVKAAIAYKAAYAPVARTIIEVDTPGLTAVNPARFAYKHIRRPMFPLDR